MGVCFGPELMLSPLTPRVPVAGTAPACLGAGVSESAPFPRRGSKPRLVFQLLGRVPGCALHKPISVTPWCNSDSLLLACAQSLPSFKGRPANSGSRGAPNYPPPKLPLRDFKTQ